MEQNVPRPLCSVAWRWAAAGALVGGGWKFGPRRDDGLALSGKATANSRRRRAGDPPRGWVACVRLPCATTLGRRASRRTTARLSPGRAAAPSTRIPTRTRIFTAARPRARTAMRTSRPRRLYALVEKRRLARRHTIRHVYAQRVAPPPGAGDRLGCDRLWRGAPASQLRRARLQLHLEGTAAGGQRQGSRACCGVALRDHRGGGVGAHWLSVRRSRCVWWLNPPRNAAGARAAPPDRSHRGGRRLLPHGDASSSTRLAVGVEVDRRGKMLSASLEVGEPAAVDGPCGDLAVQATEAREVRLDAISQAYLDGGWRSS